MVLLYSIPLIPNIACLLWLFLSWSEGLGRPKLRLVATSLPLLGAILAYHSLADPSSRFMAQSPVVLSYALQVVILRWNLTNPVSKAQHFFLACLTIATTSTLFGIRGWTDPCAFMLCI